MGIETVGKVLVTVEVENLEDLYKAKLGLISPDVVRRVKVDDALIDTGASSLAMPLRLIRQLGLEPTRIRESRTASGRRMVQLYEAVKLTIQGRDCLSDVTELPDDCPVLIGQLPLEQLDFVVDPVAHLLIGNPAHGGEHVIELY